MRGGITFRMPVVVGNRDDPIKGCKDVPRDVRVGILIDGDRRRRMRDKNLAESFSDPAFSNPFRYEFRNIDHFTLDLGSDGE